MVVEQCQKEIEGLSIQRRVLSINDQKIVLMISEIIETFNNLTSIYIKAPIEGKTEIIRSIANGIIIQENEARIVFKKPYSILLKPEIIDINKKTVSKFATVPVCGLKTTRHELFIPTNYFPSRKVPQGFNLTAM